MRCLNTWRFFYLTQVPARERRQVSYYMQPFPSVCEGHRFGVNRILLLEDDSLLSAGRDGVVRRWDVTSFMSPGGPRPDGELFRSISWSV